MYKIKDFLFKKRRLSKKALVIFLVICSTFSCFLLYDNFSLQVERIKVEGDKTEELHGLKIIHISDYHNRKSDVINGAVFKTLDNEKPDLIFITGDLIDKNKTDIEAALDFVERLCTYAPVYYVTGNHECNVSIENQKSFDDMIERLSAMGVNVLRQSFDEIELKNGEVLNIYGIDDPYFHCLYSSEISDTTDKLCNSFSLDEDEYNILLAHHPEQLSVYANHGFDLVLSGHAHGGQGRMFGQGVIAPDQGFFPKYTSGLYSEAGTRLVLSRGIGNSIIPVRVFNKSHLIIVEF